MTEFTERFGAGQVLRLEETFRCPQSLCDISSKFVSKNPAQINKRVRSNTAAVGPALQAFVVKKKSGIQPGISKFLSSLVQGLQTGTIPLEPDRKIKVYVLGRYNRDKTFIPDD
jgi:DNA helicase-4